jgi:hypothetical protein
MKASQSRTFEELWTFLQMQSQKPRSAMMKLALMRTATGKRDPELPLLQRISALEFHRVQVTDTSQNKLTAWIMPLLLKDTNNNKRLAWAKKHKQWTLDRWKSVLWSEPKCEIFGSKLLVFVRRRVGARMISVCVVPSVKHGGGVMVWGCFAGDNVCDFFRFIRHT